MSAIDHMREAIRRWQAELREKTGDKQSAEPEARRTRNRQNVAPITATQTIRKVIQ